MDIYLPVAGVSQSLLVILALGGAVGLLSGKIGVGGCFAVLLLAGVVVVAQLGSRIGARLRAEQLRILLALMVLALAVKVAKDLTVPPADIYDVGIGE